MVSSVSPRSARYGCSRSSLSRRNFSALFGALLSFEGAGLGAAFGWEVGLFLGASSASSAASPELPDMASWSRPNHSMALRAAAWMVTPSIRAMKSRVLPPCLHSLKQFQTFLLVLTRNCVGLLPLWMGQTPLKLSPLRLN